MIAVMLSAVRRSCASWAGHLKSDLTTASGERSNGINRTPVGWSMRDRANIAATTSATMIDARRCSPDEPDTPFRPCSCGQGYSRPGAILPVQSEELIALQRLETSLPGVCELRPKIFHDARGFFMETYHR